MEALRLFWDYARGVAAYFSPLKIGGGLLVLTFIAVVMAYHFLGLDATLSWLADSVPMAVALVGIIIISYKQINEKNHFTATVVLTIVGFIGTSILHWSRERDQRAHKGEVDGLNTKIDTVGSQNTQILLSLSSARPSTSQNPQAAELQRRENIEKALRGEYILSHDNISPGLLAGTEYPPADWMNKRLHELGEKWTVAPPATPRPANAPAPQPPPEGKVVVELAIGDDNASNISMKLDPAKIGTTIPSFDCLAPFTCYSEDQLKATSTELDFTGKKYRRLFFAVANPSVALISKSTVQIALSPLDDIAGLKGVSLYRPNQGRDGQQHDAVEYNQNETVDLVPYSRTHSAVDFVVDLEVDEGSAQNFVVVFGVSAANLTLHVVPVTIHIVRH